ncbi:hypothetical protein TrVE_jg13142 [Triparma verrucosa]|uniref:Cytochrome c-553 n=2 Tax=Triparma TaxID=722752 RepID=A0A9W7DY17_9STRA|nr:hypothetical protein TrST_g14307 [Triparma strigata]GMH90955.1 hypothetical protein TrVE_jg13142 [Triparma verrucosa]
MKFSILLTLLASASAYSITKPAFLKAKSTAAITAALCTSLIASPAFAGDVGAGEQVFSANCAACHAGGQNVIMPEKTLQKDALTQYLSGGMKEGSVVMQVTNGKNAMPAFGGRLSDDDIANVASYVIDQASGDKWDE